MSDPYAHKCCKVISTKSHAPSRAQMEQLLEFAGYQVSKFVDFYTEDVIRTGIEYAKDLKKRYTLLNLLQDVGLIRRFASQMQLPADRN